MMKFVRLLSLFGTLCALCAAADYQIAPAEGGYFRLEVAKSGLLSGKKHVFLFSRYHGSVSGTADKPASANVSLVIESASIQCQDDWPSAADKVKIQKYAEDKMLQVGQFHEMKFQSKAIQLESGSRYQAAGMLTIRNVEKPVTVALELAPNGKDAYWATGTATVKISDYGLKPASAALGTVGTKDEMAVLFKVLMKR